MELNLTTILITVIGGLLIAAVMNIRAQATLQQNAAKAQSMILDRFDRLDRTAEALTKENAALKAEVTGLRAAKDILAANQTTERTLSDNRAEKYGELQEQVRTLRAANETSQGESKGWQKIAEDLRVLVDGYPLQVKTLEAIARRLGAEASPAAAASVEREIADAKPAAAQYPAPPTPTANPVIDVNIVSQEIPVEVTKAAIEAKRQGVIVPKADEPAA